jgi:hypothetical protein
MKRLSILIFTIILLGCEGGFDKSLISNTEKLISPYGEYTLYRCHISSPMAFGSGFSVINILKSGEAYDFTTRDILRFGNSYPFMIKWIDSKTLVVKCLMSGEGLSEHQPIKKETVKWKDWTFEVEYYGMYSSGAETALQFENCFVSENEITFKLKDDVLKLNKNEVQFSLDSNHVYVTEFTMSTFDAKQGLSFARYKLTPQSNWNQKLLHDQQPFVRIKL